MTIFQKILERNGLSKHDGRPLWQYRCTTEEYSLLKEEIHNQLSYGALGIDIDSVLFAAEWWRNEYSGGPPSWNDLVTAIGTKPEYFSESFKAACKKGGDKLGLEWIVFKNRHYLRTLLVQGGLPLKRVSQNLGNFSTFLESLLKKMDLYGEDQINVEWLNSSNIINYLPKSFQNEIIYELAIKTARAILLNDDNELPFDTNADINIKKMVSHLKETRRNKRNESGIGVRILWELKIKDSEAIISFQPITDSILTDSFLIRNKIPEYLSDIRIFVSKKEVAYYRWNASGETLTRYSEKRSILSWSSENFVQCNVLVDNKQMFEIVIPGQSVPDLDLPQLMNCSEDSTFSLTQKTSTGFKKAALFLPEKWTLHSNNDAEILSTIKVIFNNKNYCIVTFSGTLEVVNQSEKLTFRTNYENADELITYDQPKPSWVLHSNKEIYAGEISFRHFNEDGPSKKIDNRNIFWRPNINGEWVSLSSNKPVIGNINFQIKSSDTVYYCRGFFLSTTTIESIAVGPREGNIIINNFSGVVNVLTDVETCIKKENRMIKISISVRPGNEPPGKMVLKLETPSQNGSITIEILPPFKGAYFTDPDGNILKRNTRLCVNSLAGYRLLCLGDHYRMIIRAVGEFNDFSESIELEPGTFPLYQYEEIIAGLLRLQDPIDQSTVVEISLLDRNGSIVTTVRIAQFNCFTTDGVPFYLTDADGISVDSDTILNGFHLGDMGDEISKTTLNFADNGYNFIPNTANGPWIIFNSDMLLYHLRPTLKLNGPVNVNEMSSDLAKVNTIVDRGMRKNAIRELLSKELFNSTVWREITKYYMFLIDNNLPISVLDYFHVIAENPSLAVRFFIALQLEIKFKSDMEMLNSLLKMEDTLPFLWHLTPVSYWHQGFSELNNLPEFVFNKIVDRLKFFLTEMFTNNEEYQPGQLIFNLACNPAKKEADPGTVPKTLLLELQMQIKQPDNWPKKWIPDVPNHYRNLFDISGFEQYHLALLRAPFRAALIVTGKDTGYWLKHNKSKRMQYYRKKAPNWYDAAFAHLLKRIIASTGVIDGF